MAVLVVAFAALAFPIGRVGKVGSLAEVDLAARLAAVARGERPPLTVAVLGNSRPRAGVSPRLLHEAFSEAGRRDVYAQNFAVDGTDSLHHASFGRNVLLRAEGAPPVVVWAVDPLMFDATRKSNRLEQLSARDIDPLTDAGAPLELVLDVGLMSVFPPYRHRPPLLLAVEDKTEGLGKRLARVQRRLGLVERESPRPRVYENEGDGFEPFRVVADWEFRFYERHAVHYAAEYEKLVVSDWHVAFARQFLATARQWGALVVLVELPTAPYYRAHFGATKKHKAWRAAMVKLAADEGALFYDHSARFDADRDFGDPGHMHRATAETYSRQLGAELAADAKVQAVLAARSGTGKGAR